MFLKFLNRLTDRLFLFFDLDRKIIALNREIELEGDRIVDQAGYDSCLTWLNIDKN